MVQLTTLLGILPFLYQPICALPHAAPHPTYPIRTVFEFPNETWVENIAIRASGELLVTTISSPAVFQVDPFLSVPAKVIHTFPGSLSTLGIAEIQPDIFAVITGNFSLAAFSSVKGTYSLWKVDMTDIKCDDLISKPTATKIADIPEASFLNGLTLVEKSSPYLLASDSSLGVVFRINHVTGEYKIVMDNALMKPATGQIIGINGVHTRDGYLYFTNSFQLIFARVKVSSEGTATGPYEIVAESGLGDDFAFDSAGNAYIAQDPGSALEQVTPAGKVTVLAGNVNSTILEGDTSAAFGRTRSDSETLYVVTNGGIAGHPADTNIVGGKVLAVDIPALLKQQH